MELAALPGTITERGAGGPAGAMPRRSGRGQVGGMRVVGL